MPRRLAHAGAPLVTLKRSNGVRRGGGGSVQAGPHGPEGAGTDDCIVSMDARRTHECVPCGHTCACGTCAARLRDKQCPACRAFVTSTLKIFD